jgi:hypothetical protein
MKFGFYSKKDTTAELIDVREFNEIGQALTFFAARKGPPVDTFLRPCLPGQGVQSVVIPSTRLLLLPLVGTRLMRSTLKERNTDGTLLIISKQSTQVAPVSVLVT